MIFGLDLDDTLYDRNKVYENVFYYMEENIIKTGENFEDFNKVFQQESLDEFDLYSNKQKSMHAYKIDRVISTYKYFGFNVNRDIAEAFNNSYTYFRKKISLRPVMRKILELLCVNNVNIFCLTNGPTEAQLEKFHVLGLEEFMSKDTFFISSEIGYAKPKSEAFKYINDYYNVNVEPIYYLGDNLQNDVLASLKCGWIPIWYNYENLPEVENLISFSDDEELYKYIVNLVEENN